MNTLNPEIKSSCPNRMILYIFNLTFDSTVILAIFVINRRKLCQKYNELVLRAVKHVLRICDLDLCSQLVTGVINQQIISSKVC